MQQAVSFIWYVIESVIRQGNFSFRFGSGGSVITVGIFDFLLVCFLVGLLIRNFVHIAR